VQFATREHRASRIITVTVEGELDLLTAPKLVAQVDQLLRAEPGDVVLDLDQTLLIDSSGLAILLNLQRGSSDAVTGSESCAATGLSDG
jgi:anti-anti-sigma factor